MFQYKQDFDTYVGAKSSPNEHEKYLFARAEKYIQRLTWIPGIEMIAIVNSLSMYATHEDSDIDLFIVTKPGMLWFVRFIVTSIFWIAGVWRHGEDIAGNFCLSFFITTDALDMNEIAIVEDIYLYYWIYYMKPIFIRGDIYERFLGANSWVKMPLEQILKNKQYTLIIASGKEGTQQGLGEETVGVRGKSEYRGAKRTSFSSPNSFGTFGSKSTEKLCLFCNILIRYIFLPKTLKNYEKLGKPEGIIISDSMLKFHNQDRRKEVRDKILKKNFDK